MKQKFIGSSIVSSNDVYILHHWVPNNIISDIPVFVIPPHAGRHGNIAQRMIDTCVKNGRHTFTIELLSATYKTRNTSINDLVMNLYNSQEIINLICGSTKIDLVCLCQGAWLGAIYTSRFQERVNRYANFAGPINTHTGEDNTIENYCKNINMQWHRMVVEMHNGIQPGYMQWLSFSMVDPTFVYYTRWAEYTKAIFEGNRKIIEKHRRNNGWYDYTQDLAGSWFLDCLENHFVKNKLYNGTWEVGGKPVNLGNITCDIYLYGGEKDEITHPEQVFSMADVVNSKNIVITTFEGAGHTKVFVGTNELKCFEEQFFVQ